MVFVWHKKEYEKERSSQEISYPRAPEKVSMHVYGTVSSFEQFASRGSSKSRSCLAKFTTSLPIDTAAVNHGRAGIGAVSVQGRDYRVGGGFVIGVAC